jgi:hypothetical protein
VNTPHDDFLPHRHTTRAGHRFHRTRFNFMSKTASLVSSTLSRNACPANSRTRSCSVRSSSRRSYSTPTPTDMEAATALSCSAAALDLFTCLSYRCFVAKAARVCRSFGDVGLVNQPGSSESFRPGTFRERVSRDGLIWFARYGPSARRGSMPRELVCGLIGPVQL